MTDPDMDYKLNIKNSAMLTTNVENNIKDIPGTFNLLGVNVQVCEQCSVQWVFKHLDFIALSLSS